MAKKEITVKPQWKYKDSVTGDDYFSGGRDYTFELDIPDEAFPKREDFVSNYDFDKAYAKVYDTYKDDIKQQALDTLRQNVMSPPFRFETYVPLQWSKRQFGDTVYLNEGGWTVRPSLTDRLLKDIPDVDIVNEGGINWDWFSISNADQAKKLKGIASEYYPGSASRIDTDDSGAYHFRLHKYDEDADLAAALSKLAEIAEKKRTQGNIIEGIKDFGQLE